MANRHFKKKFLSFIQENQIQTTIQYYDIPTRMAEKMWTFSNTGETGILTHCWCECKMK